MKPLNFDNSPCSPTSSNCVIWAGPDLKCINLCRGDSITDVIEKLATELCTILDTLNINSYDLDCFNLVSCAPSTFTDLINFLILKVCELENIPVTPGVPPSNGCPTDCIVSVAPCFVSGSITTMNLTEYVIAIGEKICALIDANALQDIAIGDLEVRVTNLENTSPPSYTTPTFTLGCTIDTLLINTTQAIDTVLRVFINNVWCPYVSATGTAGCLLIATANQTVAPSDFSKVNPAVQMSVQYAGLWVVPTGAPTVCDTINNIWACIKDLRDGSVTVSALDTPTINMTVTGGPAYVVSAEVIPSAPSVANTSSVGLTVGAGPTYTLTADVVDTGWKDLEGFTYYGVDADIPQCRRIGNQIHFRGVVMLPLDNPAAPGFVVPLPTFNSYNGTVGCTTFSGLGGCQLSGNGSATINNNVSVIPLSILDGVTLLDGNYFLPNIIGTRSINVDAVMGTTLTGVFTVLITSDKKLVISTLKDQEIPTTRLSSAAIGTSSLRFITSTITAGDNIPNYIITSTIHNAPSGPAYNLSTDSTMRTWPFSCDPGEETDIGGFSMRIDGLIAYVSPCTTDIKPHIVC